MRDWGWPSREHVLPWVLPSHVGPHAIDRSKGEMLLAVERLGFPCDGDEDEADAVALLLLKLSEAAALSSKEG